MMMCSIIVRYDFICFMKSMLVIVMMVVVEVVVMMVMMKLTSG